MNGSEVKIEVFRRRSPDFEWESLSPSDFTERANKEMANLVRLFSQHVEVGEFHFRNHSQALLGFRFITQGSSMYIEMNVSV